MLAVVEAAERAEAAARTGSRTWSHSTGVSVASADDDGDGQDGNNGWQTVPDRKHGKTGGAARDASALSALSPSQAAGIVQESIKWGAQGLEVCLADKGLTDADICFLAKNMQEALVGFLLDAGPRQSVGIDVKLNGNLCGASGLEAVCTALGRVCASDILDNAPFIRTLFLHKNKLDDDAVRVVAGLLGTQRRAGTRFHMSLCCPVVAYFSSPSLLPSLPPSPSLPPFLHSSLPPSLLVCPLPLSSLNPFFSILRAHSLLLGGALKV